MRGLGWARTTEPAATGGYAINWRAAGAYTGMVIKRDPGQGLIWLAYLSLISGLVLTFYFPRRRVWARLDGDRLELAMTAERYVNVEREFDPELSRARRRRTSTASTCSARSRSASTWPSRSSRSCAARSTATSRSTRRSSTRSPTGEGMGHGARRHPLHPLVRAHDRLHRREARLLPRADRGRGRPSPSSPART
jgi:hypothetical protein